MHANFISISNTNIESIKHKQYVEIYFQDRIGKMSSCIQDSG